ncbi:WXG100 family type VII secretion target [Streptomyces sp. NPDC002536]
MSAGKFDGLSHNELYAMVADASPSQLTEMGSALSEASMELNAISDLLRHHVERVKWQGEGGDAFREWGGEMVKQAAKLADYTVFAGSYIGQAGDGLSEVKSAMPKPDPAAECLTDPEKEQARLKVTESHRQEAINLMNKLDSYYRVAHEGLAGLEEPEFRPIHLAEIGVGEWERPYDGPEVFGGKGMGGSGAYTPPTSVAADSTRTAHAAGPQHQGSAVGASAGVMGDAVVGAHPHFPSGADGVAGTAIDSTGIAAPPSNAGMRSGNAVAPGTLNQAGGTGPVGPVTPSAPLLGMPSSGASRTVAELPGGSNAVGSSKGGISVPRYGGIPRTGASDGIIGGTPTRSGGDVGGQRLPRGTVVGEEPGAMNRGPAGAGGHAGAPAGVPSSERSGPSRRLAREPGGVVAGPYGSGQLPSTGSRLPRGTIVGAEHDIRGGATDMPRTWRGDREDFTPGGSGLVRENPTPGPLHSGAAGGSGSRRRAVSRPDYLTEDEETWSGGRRDTVPPVIQ